MSANGAKEQVLGELHAKVAVVMTKALTSLEVAQDRYLQAENEEVLPPEVSAPLLGAITKFLSDNRITCTPAESAELTDLEKTLADKRAKRVRRVGNVIPMINDE